MVAWPLRARKTELLSGPGCQQEGVNLASGAHGQRKGGARAHRDSADWGEGWAGGARAACAGRAGWVLARAYGPGWGEAGPLVSGLGESRLGRAREGKEGVGRGFGWARLGLGFGFGFGFLF